MSGDHNQYQKTKSYLNDDFECPRCGHCCQALETEQEPLEYWNAVEGWVKIDEVREHFDAVGCGTIYKSAGEGRSPLYTAPQKKEWVGLTDEEIEEIVGPWGGTPIKGYTRKLFDQIEAKLKEKNNG